MSTIAQANEAGLNIPYPYNIGWIADEERPIGLIVIQGFLKEYGIQMEALIKKKQREAESGSGSETYESDI